jgi:ABC-type lipoprotein export system ATPase subunit
MKKLIISHLNFKFNKQRNYFFHDANITFESGKIYFIQGKNGVGKTTFFSILQGTTPHNAQLSGSVTFNNKEYIIKNNTMHAELSAHIKTMLQDSNKMVVNTMTVEENLKLAQLPFYPRLKPLCNSTHIPAIMHIFNIDQSLPVQQLSGGQKQILAIIMTLQKPTQVLLLDEPTAALDDKNSQTVMQFLATLAKELDLIVVIITHDKELVESYKDHSIITIKKDEHEIRSIKIDL